jgi:hypothetical protein
MNRLLPVLLLFLSFASASADTIREALVNLCDPAKIATISSERGANPRVRKIAYWLEMDRRDGRDPGQLPRCVILSSIEKKDSHQQYRIRLVYRNEYTPHSRLLGSYCHRFRDDFFIRN